MTVAATQLRPRTRGRAESTTRFLPEIQALRAVAVLLVLTYHLWPGRVSGGFVGVDVFFVISGFLITDHLVKPLFRGERLDVLRFWSNRIWRLLPASFAVLLASLAFALFVVPAGAASATLRQLGSAAAYVLNWGLAGDAVDYLAADNDPTMAQHYWSLSVEEQFYLVWPPLLVAAAFFAAKVWGSRAPSRRLPLVLGGVIALLAVVSLTYSIVTTSVHPQRAYFDTFTRVWEFAFGGLAAILVRYLHAAVDRLRAHPLVAKAALPAWAGLFLIGASALAMSGRTPFPGAWALVPVLGTILVILGGSPAAGGGLHRVLRAKPLQFLGDVSYSLYLWHWPLIVGFAVVAQRRHGIVEGVAIAAASVLLAWLTKVLIEDPTRAFGRKQRRTWPAFALALIGAILIAGTAWTIAYERDRVAAAAAAEREEAVVDPVGCVGANATLGDGSCPTPFAVDDPSAVVLPYVDLNPDWCLTWFDEEWRSCTFGDLSARKGTVAIVGDSHAAAISNPLGDYLADEGWRLVTFTRYGCPALSPTPFGLAGQTPESESACADWTRRVTGELSTRSDIDLVVYTSFERGYSYPEEPGAVQLTADDIATTLATVASSGKRVVVMRDLAWLGGQSIPACVAGAADPAAQCGQSETLAFPDVPQEAALARLGATVGSVALRDATCADGHCYPVVGDVVVYADDNHISQTFGRSLAPYLWARITSAAGL